MRGAHGLKRTLAGCLALLFLCSSCSVLKEETAEQWEDVLPTEVTQAGSVTVYPSLYYMDETTGQLMLSSGELQLEDWKQSPTAIVQALLDSPIDLGFGYISSKTYIQQVELSADVANVYLWVDMYLNDRQRYFLSVLVANTLIENFDVHYVNVEISGKYASMLSMPLGLYERQEGILNDLYQQQREQIEALGEDDAFLVNLGFYYLAGNSGYILPEVASVDVRESDPLRRMAEVLLQLSKGAKYAQGYVSPLREEALEQVLQGGAAEGPERYFSYQNGMLNIMHAEELFLDAEGREKLCMASVFYTLHSVFPGLEKMRCEWQGMQILLDENDARQYLGSPVEIYLPSEDMTSLQKVRRIVHARQALDGNTYIRLIAKGPVEGDPETVVAAFPGGLLEEDIRSLRISGNTAILDFSENFIYGMERLTVQGQRLLVYSLVNTICSLGPVRSVQFLVEGEAVPAIRGGEIRFVSPLMENPGLTKP